MPGDAVVAEVTWLHQFRDEVRRRLKTQCTSQAALADYLGISEKHISQILTGAAGGTPHLIDQIAAAMGLRIAVTVTGHPAPLPLTLRGRKLARQPEVMLCANCRLPVTATGQPAIRAPGGLVHTGSWRGLRCPGQDTVAAPGDVLPEDEYITWLLCHAPPSHSRDRMLRADAE